MLLAAVERAVKQSFNFLLFFASLSHFFSPHFVFTWWRDKIVHDWWGSQVMKWLITWCVSQGGKWAEYLEMETCLSVGVLLQVHAGVYLECDGFKRNGL